MKPVDQKYLFIEGQQRGDCLRAAFASILEIDIEELPYKEANPLVKKIQQQIKQQTDANISEQSKECEQG